MTLIDIIKENSFCFQPSGSRYFKAQRQWDRRVKLTTGNEREDFAVGEKPRAEYPRPHQPKRPP